MVASNPIKAAVTMSPVTGMKVAVDGDRFGLTLIPSFWLATLDVVMCPLQKATKPSEPAEAAPVEDLDESAIPDTTDVVDEAAGVESASQDLAVGTAASESTVVVAPGPQTLTIDVILRELAVRVRVRRYSNRGAVLSHLPRPDRCIR